MKLYLGIPKQDVILLLSEDNKILTTENNLNIALEYPKNAAKVKIKLGKKPAKIIAGEGV